MLEFASARRAATVSINASLSTTVLILSAACLPNWLSAQTKDDPEPPPAATVLAAPPPSACPGDGSKTNQQVKVLSDTMGVDFRPYLDQVIKTVRQTWYSVIPESARRKRGKAVIRFAIMPNGSVSGMRMSAWSNDVSLDRAAWGAITSSTPFPFLPTQFKGPSLARCFSFLYNPPKATDPSNQPEKFCRAEPRPKSDNGFPIWPASAKLRVTSTQQFSVDSGPVAWKIGGDQCAKTDC